ncbi:MAG: hypothetical protein HKN50_10205 [Gammaproteobacteria bacterium]|nr:hypothetical protein [Gammaproteobacteria bacterium]
MSSMARPSLHLVTALACEAKPLIDCFGLRKQEQTDYPLFQGQLRDHKVSLVVSGLGAFNAGAASAWLAGRESALGRSQSAVWLNIGVAGHASLAPGEALLVHACRAADEIRSYYPSMVAKWPGKTAALYTLAMPSQDYPADAMIDMEASGYFTAVSRFSTAELIQSIKIISDNQRSNLEKLSPTVISDLIQSRITELCSFIDNLLAIARLPQPADYLHLISHLHASVSHRAQYARLIEHLSATGGLDEQLQQALGQANTIAEVLAMLRERRDQQVPVLNGVD